MNHTNCIDIIYIDDDNKSVIWQPKFKHKRYDMSWHESVPDDYDCYGVTLMVLRDDFYS